MNYLRYCSLLWLMLVYGLIQTANGQTLMSKLSADSQTAHFAQALKKSNIADKLESGGSFTIFVPQEAAFSKLAEKEKSNSSLLKNHIITGMAMRRSLKAMDNVTFLSGKKVSVEVKEGNQITVGSFNVNSQNIMADNGMIYIISGVIK